MKEPAIRTGLPRDLVQHILFGRTAIYELSIEWVYDTAAPEARLPEIPSSRGVLSPIMVTVEMMEGKVDLHRNILPRVVVIQQSQKFPCHRGVAKEEKLNAAL